MPAGYVRASAGDRAVAAILGCVALAVLIIASTLTPAAEGHGTHTQLGLPACGMYLATGKPCPTCGMTTSFAALASFDLIEAFKAQPFGALVGIATAVFVWGAAHVAIFGSRLGTVAMRMLTAKVVWTALTLGLAAWVYKMFTM
jgi:hypothetical protein